MALAEIEAYILDHPTDPLKAPDQKITIPGPAVDAPVVAKDAPGTTTGGEATTIPETPPAKVAPDPKVVADNARFAALARHERKIREREARLKAREAEIEGSLSSVVPEVERFMALKERAKTAPLDVIKEAFGLEYSQLTDAQMNGGKSPDLALEAVKDEIAAMKAENRRQQEAVKAERVQMLKQEQASTIQEWQGDVLAEVQADKSMTWTNKMNQQNLVPSLIQEHFRQTKRIMSVPEASRLVEDWVLNQVKTTAAAYQQSDKAAVSEAPKASTASSPGNGAKSLSNTMGVTSRPQPTNRRLSEQELMKEALAQLESLKPKP